MLEELRARIGDGRGNIVDLNSLSEVSSIPSQVRDQLRTRAADREFHHRSLPDGSPAADAPQHIVCVVVDALRADLLDESLTPGFTSMAGTAAVSPSTWTFPAVTSLLTGQYPHVHGAIRRSDDFEDSVADVIGLPPQAGSETRTLPEYLAGAGYHTRGVFSMIVPFLALKGRFASHVLYQDAPAERVFADHLRWLDAHRDERTFSYVHLSDLHEPVDPPADYWSVHDVDETIPEIRTWRFEDVVDPSPTVERYRNHRLRLYQAATEYVDTHVSAFQKRIDDLLQETLLVVVGDHGEAFWEHAALATDLFADSRPAYCVGHGGAPYEAVTRVPLLVDGIDIEADDRDERRSLIDVAPTVLDVVGLPVPRDVNGTTLTSRVNDRRLLVEGVRYGYEKKAVYDGDRKLIVSQGDDVVEALSLPDETPHALSPEDESDLLNEFPPWPGADVTDRGVDQPVSRDVRRRLDQLGYR